MVGDTIRRTSRADYVESLIDIGKRMSVEEKGSEKEPGKMKKTASLDKPEPQKKFAKIMQMTIQTIE